MIAKKILEIVKENHKKSDGKCGTTTPELINKLNLSYEEIKPHLLKLSI